MKKFPNARGVALFDIDGTLLDSSPLWTGIPAEFLVRRGIRPEEDLSEVFNKLGYGGTARYIVQKYLPEEDPRVVMNAFCDIAAEKYLLGVDEKPFATTYLRHLREMEIPCVALTSNMKKVVLPAMEKLGMTDHLEDVLSVYDIGLDKRSPELYHFIASSLSVAEERCVVFEDSLFAAENAKRANMHVVGVYDEVSRENWDNLKALSDRAVYGFDELMTEELFADVQLMGVAAPAGT